MKMTERIKIKAAKRFPIYRGQKINPETGKCDCPLMIMQKEWKRERWGMELLSRYNRRFGKVDMVNDLIEFHRGMPKD
jgi:hypothetical protein